MKVKFLKNTKPLNFVLALFMVVSFFSCDNYNEDNLRSFVALQVSEDVPITKHQTSQALLIEEYSGWSCTNCPKAAEKLEALQETFKDELVAVTIHAGSFAEPGKSNNNLDLTTPYGDSLSKVFGVSSFPAGIINRSTPPLQYAQWETAINSINDTTPHLLNINLGVKKNSSLILVGISLSPLQPIPQKILLSILILEDNILGIQLNGSTKIPNYSFNNVLRNNALSNIPLNTECLSTGETLKCNYAINIDPIWNLSNCRVVAIVTNQQTGRVIQANEIAVR